MKTIKRSLSACLVRLLIAAALFSACSKHISDPNIPDTAADSAIADSAPFSQSEPSETEAVPDPPATDPERRHPGTVPGEAETDPPEIRLPDIDLPDIDLPEIRLPDIDLPDVNLPEITPPSVNIPDTGLPQNQSEPERHGTTDTDTDFENRVILLVNQIRVEHGLSVLTPNEELRRVAREKSHDMHDLRYFDHTSPTYGSPFDMMTAFGIAYRRAGENIAMGYPSPDAVVEGWMNSPGHRANILQGDFTEIGVGYCEDGHYWTQMFIG